MKETQWIKCNFHSSTICEQTQVENVLWMKCISPSEAIETCLGWEHVLTMQSSSRDVCKVKLDFSISLCTVSKIF